MTDLAKPPKPDKWDILYKIGKTSAAVSGGATGVPGMSTLFSEFYSIVLAPPIAKRVDEFWTEVIERLAALEEKVEEFSIESLKDNPLFISVAMQATQVVSRNHQEDKLAALRNAVLNSAKGIKIEENIQMVLLRYIDDFTPLHLKMLALLDNPRQYLQTMNRPLADNLTAISLEGFIQHAILEFRKRHEDIRIIFGDLYNHGLLNTSPESINQSIGVINAQIYNQRTTDMARVLLRYITEPRELAEKNRSA